MMIWLDLQIESSWSIWSLFNHALFKLCQALVGGESRRKHDWSRVNGVHPERVWCGTGTSKPLRLGNLPNKPTQHAKMKICKQVQAKIYSPLLMMILIIIAHNFFVRCIGISMYFRCFHIYIYNYRFHDFFKVLGPALLLGVSMRSPLTIAFLCAKTLRLRTHRPAAQRQTLKRIYHGGSSWIGLDHVGWIFFKQIAFVAAQEAAS